jgi:hypothetical protein
MKQRRSSDILWYFGRLSKGRSTILGLSILGVLACVVRLDERMPGMHICGMQGKSLSFFESLPHISQVIDETACSCILGSWDGSHVVHCAVPVGWLEGINKGPQVWSFVEKK